MNDWVSLGLGSVAGALVSEGLKLVIAEAKMVLRFDSASKELASEMESVLPLVLEIESMQAGVELKNLKDTIAQAVIVIRECARVPVWNVFLKAKYTRKIKRTNAKMLRICQVQLQLVLVRNQGDSKLKMEAIHKDIQLQSMPPMEAIRKDIQLQSMPPMEAFRKDIQLQSMPPMEAIHYLCSVPKTRMADLVGGAVLGAVVAEVLKLLIKELKDLKAFKSLSKDLAPAIEKLIQSTGQINSLLNKLDLGVEDLKELKETIDRARVLVSKCPDVRWNKRAKYARKIEKIDKDILKFCQTDLQFLQQKTILQSIDANKKGFEINNETNEKHFEIVNEKLDRLSVREQHVFKDRCSVPKLNIVPVGLNWPLKELKKKLLNDSVSSLVVSASPGGGKTTLVTQLCDDEDIKREFKNIFFTVVSSTPNFRVIVQDLLQHNGYKELTFENDHQAGIGLRNLLDKLKENSKKTLLVLDDVWNGAENFLQDFPMTSPDFKILVTSRFEFRSFGPTYHLKPLEEGDAKALLIQWASRPDHASPAEYEELLQNILKRCSGIPILIEVVGVSLKGRSLDEWKGLVESWSEGETILDINPTVLKRLQPSFNALKPQLQECFLDMGSFLEDQKIRASVIIDIWGELYGKGSAVCMKYLKDFASQNLLKVVPLGSNKHEDGFYNEFLVTQHDTLRELALCQTKSEAILEKKRLNLEIREDTFPDWCLNQRHPIINASLLSISTDDLFSSSWVEMDFPNVEALVLNFSSSEYALPSFIAGMKKLKVLIITNHGFSSAKLSNFSCLSSLPNLKRIRLEKVSVTLMDIPQLQLGSLKKLSLFMCSFGEEFYDTDEINVSKALSSLQEIDIDYCYDLDKLPYWISEVVSLKILSITNCSKISILPKAIGNLSKLEVLRLCCCFNLSKLPETTARLSNLQFLDISDCLELRNLPLEIGNLQKLKTKR